LPLGIGSIDVPLSERFCHRPLPRPVPSRLLPLGIGSIDVPLSKRFCHRPRSPRPSGLRPAGPRPTRLTWPTRPTW